MSYIDWNLPPRQFGNLLHKNYPMVKSMKRKNQQPKSKVVVVRNVVQPATRVASKKRRTIRGYDLNKISSDIVNTLTRGLSNPLVLLTIALSVGVIATHDFPNKKGFIYDTFKDRSDSISKWIIDHGMKFAGMLIFLPAVVDSPRRTRPVVALLSFLWVMIIPEAKAVEYFLQSLALHTYFRLSNNNSRITVLAVIAIAWFLGFIKMGGKS